MKKSLFFVFISLLILLAAVPGFAQDEVNVLYGETYMCGDAYTVDIVGQPQMMAQVTEKLPFYQNLVDGVTGRYKSRQITVSYGMAGEDEVILHFRILLRSLNDISINGLSRESFKLIGNVRDRKIEYLPEVMMPFVVDSDDWELPIIRKNMEVYSITNRVPKDVVMFDINDYWNSKLLEEKPLLPLHTQEIRLVYRVPSFLVDWVLNVAPVPANGTLEDPAGVEYAGEEAKTCSLAMHLPTVKNEITNEIYKYIY